MKQRIFQIDRALWFILHYPDRFLRGFMRTSKAFAKPTTTGLLSLYTDRSVLVMFLCWFVCGIPLLLTASTFSLWLNDAGIENTTIGLLGWVAFPYSIKFFWAPFVDRCHLPYLSKKLGHRRSWMLVSQIGLFLSIFALSQTNPKTELGLSAGFAILTAFFSATLDFIVMAYQVERLSKRKYGAGEAMGIFGFRIGMLLSSAGAIGLAQNLSWNQVYLIMALCVLAGPIITLFIKEPTHLKSEEALLEEDIKRTYLKEHHKLPDPLAKAGAILFSAVYFPFRDFAKSQPWIMALLIMLFGRLSDNLIGNFTNIFLSDIGFTKFEIASVSKVFGMATTILGGLFAGYVIAKYGALRALIWGVIIHAFSILLFVILAEIGPNLEILYLTIALEHFTGGLRTTSLLVLQMMLVNPIFAATQVSIMNSALHLGRKIVGSFSGFFIDAFGWSLFFVICSLSSILSLIVLWVFATITVKKYPHLQMA